MPNPSSTTTNFSAFLSPRSDELDPCPHAIGAMPSSMVFHHQYRLPSLLISPQVSPSHRPYLWPPSRSLYLIIYYLVLAFSVLFLFLFLLFFSFYFILFIFVLFCFILFYFVLFCFIC